MFCCLGRIVEINFYLVWLCFDLVTSFEHNVVFVVFHNIGKSVSKMVVNNLLGN